MQYIKLLIEYDGTNYQGWQTQKTGRGIQDIVKESIYGITGERVRLSSASRTDAGVHALGQVAAFRTHSILLSGTIMRALNAKLPADIRILDCREAHGDFKPRYDARGKRYFYIISIGKKQSVFLHKYVWGLNTPLNVDDMKTASSIIIGEHDFSCFRGSGCASKQPVRTLHSIDITRQRKISFMKTAIGGDFLKITMEANAFLRHMARNIVGTLVEIGRGKIAPEKMHDILISGDRRVAGPTAPARGLFLEKIIY
jgi:tRNA pseudouridine38-40 synthase